MFDCVVIGAGVVGGLVCRELTKYKLSVCIVEKESDVAMGATRANSAIVHAGFDAKEGTLKARFNVRGSEMMEDVCRELGVKYKNNGSLVVGFNEEDAATLRSLIERGIKNGVKGLSFLEREQILALEPNIGDGVTSALRASTGAIVCPYELCMAAVGNAMDNGAELKLNFEVKNIETVGGVYRISSDKDTVEARIVINCAGVYSDEIAALVGDERFTVHPRRGEYMLLDKECGSLVTHTVFRCPSRMGKGVLVTPTVDGNLLLGPTAEDIDDKDDTSTTASGLRHLASLAGEQVKGINLGKVITSFTGLRATGSVGDFVIDSPRRGFINCAGIESPGLTSAPAIAEYVVDMLRKNGEILERKDTFDGVRGAAHRFRDASLEEKQRMIKENPEYAHVICRCETVTAGEIIDAIRTNPRPTSIDGIKRRTRASMGRCQGGFCTPYMVELLARELGVDVTEITKSGGESYINVAKTAKGKQ